MPPRRRRVSLRPGPLPPDYVPGLRLAADIANRPPGIASSDPTSGYGWSGWNRPAEPLTAAQKTQTFGAVGTQIFAGRFADTQFGLTEPEEWRGDNRWRTIARMRRDGQATAIKSVCVLPLLQASFNINPGSESDADVAVAQDVADNFLHGMTGGWPFFARKFFTNRFENGHYLGEKCWTSTPDGVRLRKIAERPAPTIYRWFPDDDDELNRVMQKVWIENPNGVNGQWKFPMIPREKLLLSTRNQQANDYRGISLYYHMWEHWDYKHKLYLIDGIAAERNGMGVPTLEEPPGVRQQSDRDQAEVALENFRVGESANLQLPNGYKFTLTGVSGAVRDIMPSIQHHDLLMARSALAHFINLDAYGQVLISEAAQSLFLMAEEAEAAQAVDDINQLIREWVDYNYEGVERYPTLAITALSGARDLDAVLRGVAQLFEVGGLTNNVETENALRDDLDLPALPAEATVAGGGAPSVDPDSQGAAVHTPGEAAPARPQTPGTTAKQALSQKPAFAAGDLGPRMIHLSGPRLAERRFTVRMSGAYPRTVTDAALGELTAWERSADRDAFAPRWLGAEMTGAVRQLLRERPEESAIVFAEARALLSGAGVAA